MCVNQQGQGSPRGPCRYLSREDFVGAHRSSAAFLRYKAQQAELPFTMEVSGQSYYESNNGFM